MTLPTSPQANISSIVRSTLKAGWTHSPAVPILFPNMNIASIEATAGVLPDSFIALEVLMSKSIIASIGVPTARKHRFPGVIMIHAYVKVGAGSGLAEQLCDDACAIFRAQVFQGLICLEASPGSGGPADDEGQFWRQSASIAFYKDFNL